MPGGDHVSGGLGVCVCLYTHQQLILHSTEVVKVNPIQTQEGWEAVKIQYVLTGNGFSGGSF